MVPFPPSPLGSCSPSRPFHVAALEPSAAPRPSAALGVDAALELRRELRAEALRGAADVGCMAHAEGRGRSGGWWLVKPV